MAGVDSGPEAFGAFRLQGRNSLKSKGLEENVERLRLRICMCLCVCIYIYR